MIFNLNNQRLSLYNDEEDDNYFDYVEVLNPNKDKKEKSEIEKRFKKPMKEISKIQKQLDSTASEIKHRIRDVRKNHGNQFVFEKDMYNTLSNVLSSKITAADKKSSMIKSMIDLEIKEKKLQKNMGNVNSNNPLDMRGTYAEMFNNSDSRLNTSLLSNPEKSRPLKTKPPKTTKNNTNQKQPNKNKDNNKENVDYKNVKEKYGLDYKNSAGNLKYRNKEIKEELHIDVKNELYWLVKKDENGKEITEVQNKHIDSLGEELEIDPEENIAMDAFNNSYEYVEDSIKNMPEEYKKQWREKGKDV